MAAQSGSPMSGGASNVSFSSGFVGFSSGPWSVPFRRCFCSVLMSCFAPSSECDSLPRVSCSVSPLFRFSVLRVVSQSDLLLYLLLRECCRLYSVLLRFGMCLGE